MFVEYENVYAITECVKREWGCKLNNSKIAIKDSLYYSHGTGMRNPTSSCGAWEQESTG